MISLHETLRFTEYQTHINDSAPLIKNYSECRRLLNRVINAHPFELQYIFPNINFVVREHDWLDVIKKLIYWMLRIASTS